MNEQPLRDLNLQTFTIQGKEYEQRKPSFDYRIKEAKLKLGDRWDKFYKSVIQDSLAELRESSDQLKKAFEYIGADEITAIIEGKLTDKVNKFADESPQAFQVFVRTLNMIVSDVFTAMQLFIVNPQNKKDLFYICLETTEGINFEPQTEEEDLELDKAGLELLNFFVLNRQTVRKLFNFSQTNTASIN